MPKPACSLVTTCPVGDRKAFTAVLQLLDGVHEAESKVRPEVVAVNCAVKGMTCAKLPFSGSELSQLSVRSSITLAGNRLPFVSVISMVVKYSWLPLFRPVRSAVENGATGTFFVKAELSSWMPAGGQLANASGVLSVPFSSAYTLTTPASRAATVPYSPAKATVEPEVDQV